MMTSPQAASSPIPSKPGWLTIIGAPLGLAAIMTPPILLAAGGHGQGFNAVVHSIEHRYHVHATRVPFMGLISGITGIATHGGIHNLHVAEFENFRGDANQPGGGVNGEEFLNLVQQHSGGGWQRMIRETSRAGDEQTLIYIRSEGKQVGMLVVDLDHSELDVVQISMNPDRLLDEVREHRGHHHSQDDDEDSTSTNSDSAAAEGN